MPRRFGPSRPSTSPHENKRCVQNEPARKFNGPGFIHSSATSRFWACRRQSGSNRLKSRLTGWSQWVDATLKSNPTCVAHLTLLGLAPMQAQAASSAPFYPTAIAITEGRSDTYRGSEGPGTAVPFSLVNLKSLNPIILDEFVLSFCSSRPLDQRRSAPIGINPHRIRLIPLDIAS